ncbi:MAG: hypothetical protein H0U74_17555 [Bradymonadaceae bacterium]|nr:hypothetical protein [Lujinxingiaceae bacterium]
MNELRNHAPKNNLALRRALYEGDVFLLDSTPAAERLVSEASALVREAFAEFDEPRTAQHSLDNLDFFRRVGAVRRTLFTEQRYHRTLTDVVAELGFDPSEVVFDPARIRAIADRGHLNPAAAPAYYAHRDTWYAHPQAMITWWIPLDDLNEEETFVFYPDWLRAVVPNDSESFDYADWVREGPDLRIGWQDPEAGKKAPYPGMTGEIAYGRELGFSCRRAQNLLFSGAHLHRTRPQSSGRTRFSLDFRLVHLADHAAGLGAPNVDNRSRGTALGDYSPMALEG